MRTRYWIALAIVAFGLGSIAWAWFDSGSVAVPALIIGSAAVPAAALMMVAGRLDERPPLTAAVGGGTIGVAIALLSHAFVFAFAYFFLFGFAEEATALIDLLGIDPQLSTALTSPWTLLLLIELVIVAPLTEEFGKAVGSRIFNATSRQTAFLAGVAAGTGFAIVENIFYALGGEFIGAPWEAIVIGRMFGAAVHPLASGLVVLGWWEWRRGRDFKLLATRFLSGAGVHAMWNGAIVVLGIAASAFDTEASFGTFTVVSLGYTAALGMVTAGALWLTTTSIAEGSEKLINADSTDGRVIGAWTVLTASFLVPMAMLLLAFPDFVGG